MDNWKAVWDAHPDVFLARNWQECPIDKRKDWRLPVHFKYFMAGETALRVGVVVSSTQPKEEEFLLAGLMWGNRLSNGAKTVIYYVAPDFSPFFLHAINKIGGNLNARAVYWREKLSPSLYLIPESNSHLLTKYPLGEEKPDWNRWKIGLNPVAQHQLDVIRKFFDDLADRRIRAEFKHQLIQFLWGNFEIAELRRKGKKIELMSKAKWERNPDKAKQWQKSGWVDASGCLNRDFCNTILNMISYLEEKEKRGELKAKDLLSLWLHHGGGVVSTLWGDPWEWPWLPKERGESWVVELGQWYYFQGNGQLSVVCPILEKPLYQASLSLLHSCVLEKSSLLSPVRLKAGDFLWDARIHWLTLQSMEEDLRVWHSWLKNPEQFQIWILPENWQVSGLNELTCKSIPTSESMPMFPL